MNVKQLIEELQKYDPETMVVVRGYEDGVNEASAATKTKINLNVFSEWYYGKHDRVPADSESFDCEAIYIN